MRNTLSLLDFAHSITTVGQDITIIGQGECGIGKSTALKLAANTLTNHIPVYIDCCLLDVGDLAIPTVVKENDTLVTHFAPNARFKFHQDKPVIVMLDEIGKASKPVKNALLTLMLEHRIGSHHLPSGSIVFGTTNLASEGLGDLLEAHARNRVCMVDIAKPNADAWLKWSIDNGIAAQVNAWVKQYPHCLASYTDGGQDDNPYIQHGSKTKAAAFVTPRSLEKASNIIKQRSKLGHETTLALLAGTIGLSAAKDMSCYVDVADELTPYADVVENPEKSKLPSNPVACSVMVFGAAAYISDAKAFTAIHKYINRLDPEFQALFARSVMTSDRLQPIALADTKFAKWAMDNAYIF